MLVDDLLRLQPECSIEWFDSELGKHWLVRVGMPLGYQPQRLIAASRGGRGPRAPKEEADVDVGEARRRQYGAVYCKIHHAGRTGSTCSGSRAGTFNDRERDWSLKHLPRRARDSLLQLTSSGDVGRLIGHRAGRMPT